MPDRLIEDLTRLWEMMPAIALAVMGGIVKWARGGSCSLAGLFVGLLSAGFAGVVVYLLLDGTTVSHTMRGAAVGIAGYAGGDLLQVFSRRMCRWAMGGVDERGDR